MSRLIITVLAGLAVLALASPASAAKPSAQIVQFKSGGSSSSEGTSPVKVPIVLSQKVPAAQTMSVTFETAGGTATASPDATCSGNEDYIPVAPTLVTFNAGQNQLNSPNIVICDNNRFENSETVQLLLSNPTAPWNLGPKQTATLTITDNDPAPTVTIDDSTPTSVTEGGNLVFDVHVTGSSLVPTSVDYQALSGTIAPVGTNLLDWPATSGTLAWGPGDTSDRQITLPTTDDSLDELDGESVRMRLQNVINGSIDDATGAGQIDDNDLVVASANNPTDAEDGTMPFVISLDQAPASSVTVNYTTRDDLDGATAGPCSTPGNDYESKSGSVVFAAGETSKPVTVTTCGDSTPEPDEGIRLELNGITNGTITDDTGDGLLANDDVTISIDDPSATEDVAGVPGTMTFTVTLDFASIRTVTVDFLTSGTGTAVCQPFGTSDGSLDFVDKTGTVTFLPGETSKTIDVVLCPDSVVESGETVTVPLSNPTTTGVSDGASAVISATDGTGTGTIND